MFPAQQFVICVPMNQVDPFVVPAPQYQQHELESQKLEKPEETQKQESQASRAEAGAAILELLRLPGLGSRFDAAVEDCSEDVFDYSTPEPSPRLWKSSTPPTPFTQCPPSPDGSTVSRATSPPLPVDTDYSPSPVAMHGCYAVMMPTMFQPMVGTWNPDGSYNDYFCENGYFVPEVGMVQMPTSSSAPFGWSESWADASSSPLGRSESWADASSFGATDEPEGNGYFVPEVGMVQMSTGSSLPFGRSESWADASLVPEGGQRQGKAARNSEVAFEEKACQPTAAPVAGGGPATRLVPDGFTTLVIRNIPARYNQEMLLAEFIPDGSFDFFFLPYSFKDARTMGIAFLNFRTHASALIFQEKWHRQFLQDHGRTKHLDVAAATTQGLEANLQQFNSKSIARFQRVGMLPVFMDEAANRVDPLRELQRFGRI
ncbi:unnamed protein product [Polarella glacialis]|uniref:Mei2-like C-terminal RNA recognition motif domain-containing protein n=1 Tax=Polarella glacialis TaxID=89957 RepID=A0A813JI58_POLGL|nr:unnamed protein product [Polarella glacialis]